MCILHKQMQPITRTVGCNDARITLRRVSAFLHIWRHVHIFTISEWWICDWWLQPITGLSITHLTVLLCMHGHKTLWLLNDPNCSLMMNARNNSIVEPLCVHTTHDCVHKAAKTHFNCSNCGIARCCRGTDLSLQG